MSLNPDAVGGRTDGEMPPDAVHRLIPAFLETYRGPHGGATGTEAAVTGPVQRPANADMALPALVEAQYQLGRQRSPGSTGVAVYAATIPVVSVRHCRS